MNVLRIACVLIGALWTSLGAAYQCAVSANGLAFGAYDVFSPAPLVASGTLTVTCAARNFFELFFGFTATFSVALSGGSSGNPANRAIAGSGDTLVYNIYADPTHSVIWGDGAGGTSTQPGRIAVPPFAFRGTQSFTAYGRVPAAQNVSATAYQDTLVVTVNY